MEAVLEPIVAPLRPFIQPITHNLPSPLVNFATSLLGPKCYTTLLTEIKPEDACVKLGISKALGMAIIGASSIVKIPQILKLRASKSSAGISFLSYLLETTAYIIGLAYNWRSGFPISTYGETGLIMLQNVVICVLVLRYSGKTAAAAVFVAGLAIAGGALLSEGQVSMKTLSMLQGGAGVMSVASKVPQIMAVAKNKSTGVLSAFAVFNYLAGSLSRIFTTIQEVDDPLILYGFVAGFVLNLVLAIQMVYYWNSPTPAQKKGGAVKQVNNPYAVKATGPAQKKSPKNRRKA